ncbi:hypothetical protein SXCC_03585 [Gluconacetobacter sp. SXCC-1]|nr:hypothetical protein SXCC_03585 [Gluconacetobacter sp. SXCC-1]
MSVTPYPAVSIIPPAPDNRTGRVPPCAHCPLPCRQAQ